MAVIVPVAATRAISAARNRGRVNAPAAHTPGVIRAAFRTLATCVCAPL